MIRKLLRRVVGGNGKNQRVQRARQTCRRLVVEPLESRQLLSITLPSIANLTMSAGTAIYVPLNGSDPGQTISYGVSASDYAKLTPLMMPSTNDSLQFTVQINGVGRSMSFQLLDNLAPVTAAHIEALVQAGFYDGLSIYRNGKDIYGDPFVIQGGNNPPTGSIKTDQPSIAEEFNPALQFTSAGLLAMARSSAPSTSSTEFFITEDTARFLDFNYTIFGVQTAGTDVISTIAAMPNQSSAQDPYGLGYLVTPLTISSASIFTDTQNGVLELRAPAGVTGTVTVFVTASDGASAPVTQSFVVTIQADAASNPANPFAAVTPGAPSSVTFLPPAGTGSQITHLDNSDAGHALQFQVAGVSSGNVVQILADGNPIGQATAAGTTVVVTTDGTRKLTDGPHNFTAIQIAKNQTVGVTESGGSAATSQTADVPSLNSPALSLNVDTVAPQFNFTPVTTAVVGVPYACQVAASSDAGGAATYELTQKPTGMTIDSATGRIVWTPAGDQTPSVAVTVQAKDVAGNTVQQQFTINVLAANSAPVLTSTSPPLGTTDENTIFTIDLTSFINNGAGGTVIVDADPGATVGGIALVGATTGTGTWQYSLDGSAFAAVGAVSDSSALLLPHDAVLRYIPDSMNGRTASIVYRAWDATGGAAGVRLDLTPAGSIGDSGPFSADTDTASLIVSAVNDAPVLTAVGPSLGAVTFNGGAATMNLSAFINAGAGTTLVADVDEGAAIGGIAVTAASGLGTWAYSLDGTNFLALGAVSETAALLLPSTAKLRYTPNGSTAETATISYRAWDATAGVGGNRADTTINGGDSAFSANPDIAALAVISPNHAPVLTASHPALGVTIPSSAATVSLASFINGAAGTGISDADSADAVGGIALTGTTGLGTWAYSLDGTSFTAVGTVSETAALLLPSTAKLRYTPNGSTAETATITYRAWDATAGVGGNHAVTTANGGTTAFSAAADTASLTVAGAAVSGYVYLDTNNNGQKAGSEAGLAGVSVRLTSQDGSQRWTQTDVAGWYNFQGLAAGPYTIQVVPSANLSVAQSSRQVQLGVGENRGGQDFAVLGLQPSLVSLRLFLASTPPMTQVIQSMHVAPTVSLSGNSGTSGFASTYVTGGGAVAIAAAAASIASPDSATLTSMTVALHNMVDGSSELLQAVTSGTSLNSTYAGGVLTLSGVAEVSTYQTVLRSIKYGDAALPSTVATRTVSVTVNDGTAASATATTTLTFVQGAVPSGYTIAANGGTLNAVTADSAGFTFTNATVGAAYAYSVTSSGGGTPVTGSGTVASATQNVMGIDVSALSDGTLTFSVVLTNGAGAGTPATATAILDQTAPNGYSIAANQGTLDNATATAASFTFAGAEIGASYTYSVTSDGGGTPVTGSGTISSATQQVTGINLALLSNGTLTFSASLTDSAGNPGSAATATATLAQTMPSGYTITADSDTLNAATAESAGFTFANATVGATYAYTVTSDGGGTPVTGSGTVISATQDVTGIDVSALSDGTLTFSVVLTNVVGTGTPATATAILDQTAPSGYSIAANPSALDATTVTSAGFTFTGAEVGATFSYTVSSDGGGTPILGSGVVTLASQDVTGIDVSLLSDGLLTFQVILTDAAGNAGSAVSTTATLDRAP